ncbi:uncharacterized protein LOC111831497 [Capsella rubella]|uniref:uncharacterized protein LOC111831497 n=1 Tax=Capsella rubella TaxID=81985 RepID=UPI000CD5136A|nr:uncharacterized protein LOC111831497 [Capsella rubella]
MKSSLSVIHFDYEGYYSSEGEDVRWISKEDRMYSFLMKTSIREVSYSGLVEKICNKMRVDEATTQLKISYLPLLLMERKKPNDIRDDEDVVCYLKQVNKEGCRSVLHVEVTNIVEENQRTEENHGFKQGSREDLVRVVVPSNKEILPICEANNSEILYLGEPSQQNEVVEHDEKDYNVDNLEMFEDIGAERNESVRIAWEDGLNIKVGQEFGSKKTVQNLVELAGHKNCFEFDVIKSDLSRYVVKCSEAKNGCEWYVRAARRNTSECFSIRTHKNIHTCSRTTSSTSVNRRNGTPRIVASILAEDYPGKFDTPSPKNLIDLVQGRFGVSVSYSTAWRGKKQAASEIRGTAEDSFMLLHSYLFMLRKMNPDTISYVEVDKENKFLYLFFALGACIEGFRVMRKVIIVDATHLKTSHGGVLIVATAQDPDHHHYPIAFGVADGENNLSWDWFFNKLKTVVPDDPEMVFVSDRNHSLMKSIGEIYPLSQHGCCIFHLSQNVLGSVFGVKKETVAVKFRECARAYTEAEFLRLYGDFSSRYPSARAYLDKSTEVKKWARCYFPGERYNIDTTNCAESINSVFKDVRKLSLLPMIDAIVQKLADWFNKHRKASSEITNGQKLVPFVENELHTSCAKAKLLPVLELNSYQLEYIVTGRDGIKYFVDLKTKSCSCKRFDIDKYPCVHTIAAAREVKKNAAPDLELHNLASKFYWIELWVLAYYKTIYPVPHISQWTVPDQIKSLFALPPDYEVKQGRRQEKRFKSAGEYRRRKPKQKTNSLYEWFNNIGGEN